VSVIFILLPVAALLAAAAVAAFIWAVRRGQFDDLDTPAVRILHDDEDED
jgi:cbb3-type cytochrome oxidase maturation protein